MKGTIYGIRLPSLRARMTVGFTVPFALLVCLCGATIGIWSFYIARDEAARLVSSTAALLHREGLENSSRAHLDLTFKEISKEDNLSHVSVAVFNPQGTMIAANHRPIPPLPGEQNDRWLCETTNFGKAMVVVGVFWEPTRNALRQQTILLLIAGLLVTLIAVALVWVFVGRTLRPIKALSEQALAAVAEPLHLKMISPSSDAELKFLVGTLNEMLDRLRRDTMAKEQLYSAAAHELRTPLAVLSGSIENALLRPRCADEYRETLLDIHQETARLITLTESLLFLNRLEMRTDREPAEENDLSDIMERTLANLKTGVVGRGLKVTLDVDEVTLSAPPTHVRILLRNLLENAIHYATSGGQIIVTLENQRGVPNLRIFNECCLADNADLDQFFTAFYRADASRSSTTGGNGLGLSICRALARVNGWQLSLCREESGVAAIVLFGEPTA